MSVPRIFGGIDSCDYPDGILSCCVAVEHVILPRLNMLELINLSRVNRMLHGVCSRIMAERFHKRAMQLQRTGWLLVSAVYPALLPVPHFNHPFEPYDGQCILNPTFQRHITRLNCALSRFGNFQLNWQYTRDDGSLQWMFLRNMMIPSIRADNVVILVRNPGGVPGSPFPTEPDLGRVWGEGVLAHHFFMSQRRCISALVSSSKLTITEMPVHYESWFSDLDFVNVYLKNVEPEALWDCFVGCIMDLRYEAHVCAEEYQQAYGVAVTAPFILENMRIANKFAAIMLDSPV